MGAQITAQNSMTMPALTIIAAITMPVSEHQQCQAKAPDSKRQDSKEPPNTGHPRVRPAIAWERLELDPIQQRKFQDGPHWTLELGAPVEVGAWRLELHPRGALGLKHAWNRVSLPG
jgi:hypothetical protein